MAASRLRRRAVLATLAALLLAMGVPGQALAADSETFQLRGEAGFAHWSLDDARNTETFLIAFDGQFHPPEDPENAEDVLVGVSQEFCDENADERVFRSFFGFDDASVAISPSLTEGTAEAGLSLHGFDFRAPDCDDPNFDEGESSDLGTFGAQVASSWEGAGKMNTSTRVFHFNGEDFTFHSTSVDRSRDAEASATLTGLEDVGVPREQGTTQDAKLAAFNNSDVVIEH